MSTDWYAVNCGSSLGLFGNPRDNRSTTKDGPGSVGALFVRGLAELDRSSTDA